LVFLELFFDALVLKFVLAVCELIFALGFFFPTLGYLDEGWLKAVFVFIDVFHFFVFY